jgi:hypothetical protein
MVTIGTPLPVAAHVRPTTTEEAPEINPVMSTDMQEATTTPCLLETGIIVASGMTIDHHDHHLLSVVAVAVP